MHTYNTYTVTDLVIDLSPIQRLLGAIAFVLTVTSGTWLAYGAQEKILVDTPRSGGILNEGIVGTPRFINPVLAVSSADKDLVAVIFTGLMRRNAHNELIPALAERYELSEDEMVYTFTLRDGLTFHDGTPLTSADVVFTLTQVANPNIRSPLYANWEGVTVEATDARTIVITLPEPYAPFIENTTLGILPKHKWGGLADSEFAFSHFNAEPVGAGPYQFTRLVVDKTGIPERYELSAFKEYVFGTPNIVSLYFHIFREKNDALNAYSTKMVNAVHGISPESIDTVLKESGGASETVVRRAPLQRMFAVFFNQNRQPIFMRKAVREALNEMTPKQAIVGDILKGYGTVLEGPLPPHVVSALVENGTLTATSSDTADAGAEDAQSVPRITRARNILENAGWERNKESGIYEIEEKGEYVKLTFSLSTTDIPELMRTAEFIASEWRLMGAEVELKIYDSVDLTQSVIRPRKYDALLFGLELGNELDMYAFWHSSQRNDPGLNVAQFVDIEADASLLALRKTHNQKERFTYLQTFFERITRERAGIFLYTPDMTYLTQTTLRNISLHPLASPSERFDTIHEWYIETDRVWPFVPEFI